MQRIECPREFPVLFFVDCRLIDIEYRDRFIFYQRWKTKSMRYFSLDDMNFNTNSSDNIVIELNSSLPWSRHLKRHSYLSGVDVRRQVRIGIHPDLIRLVRPWLHIMSSFITLFFLQINSADSVSSSLALQTNASQSKLFFRLVGIRVLNSGNFHKIAFILRVVLKGLSCAKEVCLRNISALGISYFSKSSLLPISV